MKQPAKVRHPRIDLNPSSADRWTTCTASPKYIFDNWDRLPPSDDTKYNREGNTAHEVAAAFLQNRQPDPKNCPTKIDGEMLMHGWNYAEYVLGLKKPGAILHVEKKFPLWYMPERNAIVDVALIHPDHLHIVDYKYGAGVVVSPERSLQATIYAVCAMQGYTVADDLPVTIHIYQPRGRNSVESAAHVWETTWSEIWGIATLGIGSRAQLINRDFTARDSRNNSDVVHFAPSEKACQWCPAKGFCPERQKSLTHDIDDFQVISPDALTAPQVISEEQLALLVLRGDEIKKWITDVQDYALDYVKGGKALPGLKLVTGREGNRHWTDEKQVAKLLLKETLLRENEVFEQKVISVTAVEKLLGKTKVPADVSSLIARNPGKLMLVSEDDSRESYLVDAANEFEVIQPD